MAPVLDRIMVSDGWYPPTQRTADWTWDGVPEQPLKDWAAVAEDDDSTAFEDVPTVIKPMLFPMRAEISAIGIEYGLFQGRFWLPRVQVAQGGGQVGFVRVPFKLEQKFSYENVNALIV